MNKEQKPPVTSTNSHGIRIHISEPEQASGSASAPRVTNHPHRLSASSATILRRRPSREASDLATRLEILLSEHHFSSLVNTLCQLRDTCAGGGTSSPHGQRPILQLSQKLEQITWETIKAKYFFDKISFLYYKKYSQIDPTTYYIAVGNWIINHAVINYHDRPDSNETMRQHLLGAVSPENVSTRSRCKDPALDQILGSPR